MTYHPRTELGTHEVTNQPAPLADIALTDDPALSGALDSAFGRLADADGPRDAAGIHMDHLADFGRMAGTQKAREWGRLANECPPLLRVFNAQGQRIDEVEFHPAYHQLMQLGLEGGVSSRAWTHTDGGHIAHAALLAMMSWADGGVCCPMSMTYAVGTVLKDHDWTRKTWLPRVTTAVYDARTLPADQKKAATMGMAMTEKQGGSDLRTNTTRASLISEDEAELTGHKWFCSAPMCDAFLALAYEADGLSCWLVPRWRPDGTRNPMEIRRLKDKMGDRSNASSEIEYAGAYARRVGDPGRGIATIINMAHHTRFDCISGSAAGMRQAVVRAAFHTAQRTAFQRKLIDQPLMRNVLVDLALESEAALALAMRVGTSFDAAASSPHENALSRILTPVAKYWVCKRQPSVVYEALECLGGIGFVEETGMPRLFRTSPLNAIWEGSGNVIALDIQRALQDTDVAAAFTEEISRIGREIPATASVADELRDAGGMDPRLFAERAAILFAADALPEGAVRDGFVTLRLTSPSHCWGACASAVDGDVLIDRLTRWLPV